MEKHKKSNRKTDYFFKLGYKDSNLEMTESESVALPFGDGPLSAKTAAPAFCWYFYAARFRHDVVYNALEKKSSTFFLFFTNN